MPTLVDSLDDRASFDRAALALAPRVVLGELIASLQPEVTASIEPLLPGGSTPRLDLSRLTPLGSPALWLATRWVIAALPCRARWVPAPAHEQWDALLEIHHHAPEAAWLVAEVFASLGSARAALGRRILLGQRRRFGGRGRMILEHVAADSALSSLLDAGDVEHMSGGSQ